MNYFELYPGDYLKATQRLTLLEHGAYLRLLMAYYGEEEALPADLGELYVTVSAISAADKAAVRKVADRFFPVAADGLRHNSRADDEIAKAQRRIAAAKANGSKGGRKPKAEPNPDETQWVTHWATQPPTHSGEALHTPLAKKQQEPKQKPAPDGDLLAGVNPEVAADFKALRSKLRAPITATAMKGIRREAEAAGMSLEAALAMCCERGWRGFKAEWVAASARAGPGQNMVPLGKTAQAINALEEMKNGLAQNRTADRLPEIALLESGAHAGR